MSDLKLMKKIEKMSLLDFVIAYRREQISPEALKQFFEYYDRKEEEWHSKEDYSHGDDVLKQMEKLLYGHVAVKQMCNQEVLKNHNLFLVGIRYWYHFKERGMKKTPLSSHMKSDIEKLERKVSNLKQNTTADIVVGFFVIMLAIVGIFAVFKFAGAFSSVASVLGIVLGVLFLALLFITGIVGAIVIPGVILGLFTLIDLIIPIEVFLKWGLVLLFIVVAMLGFSSIFSGVKEKHKTEEERKQDKENVDAIIREYMDCIEKVIFAYKTIQTLDLAGDEMFKDIDDTIKGHIRYVQKNDIETQIHYYEDALKQVKNIGKPKLNRI